MNNQEMEKLVEQLVQANDCVTISGFGSFISQRVHSQIDVANQRMLPPSKNISFNRSLQKNDGLLAQEVSERRACSYDASNIMIDRFVGKINEALNSEKTYTFGNLGSFDLLSEDRLVFKAAKDAPTALDAFGLKSIAFVPAEIPQEKEEIATPIPVKEKVVEVEEKQAEPSPKKFVAEQRQKRQVRKADKTAPKKSNKKYAVALILSALVGISQLIIWDVQPKGMQLTALNLLNINPIAKEMEQLKTPEKVTDIQPEFEAKAYLDIPVIHKSEIENGYFIVLGAFSKWKYAHRLQQKAINSGFDAKLIRNEGNLIRVMVSVGELQEQATANLNYFKASWNTNAWMLENQI